MAKFFSLFILAITLAVAVSNTACIYTNTNTSTGPGGSYTSRSTMTPFGGGSTTTATQVPLRNNPNFSNAFAECQTNYESVNTIALECQSNPGRADCTAIRQREQAYNAYIRANPSQVSSQQLQYFDMVVAVQYRPLPEITSICRNSALQELWIASWGVAGIGGFGGAFVPGTGYGSYGGMMYNPQFASAAFQARLAVITQ